MNTKTSRQITLSKRRMPRNTPPDEHEWEAYIPQWTVDLMIHVRAATRAEAKRLVREQARRELGYKHLSFTR